MNTERKGGNGFFISSVQHCLILISPKKYQALGLAFI
jgi:hypothetical protein